MGKRSFKYEVTKIADGTYLVNEYFSTMFVLSGSERALVIDCGTGVGNFKSVIEKITPLPYDVAMTHAHVDHIGGRGQFKDIYVSGPDSRYVKGVNLAMRKGFTLIYSLSGDKLSGLEMYPIKKEPNVHIIRDGYEFKLGGRTVRAYLTPGHTVGSMSFLDVESRTLFIGDIANENLLMYLPHCTTIDGMIATIENVLAIDGYDTVWSSHHTEPNCKADIEKYLRGARQVAQREKNTVIPFVKLNEYEGAKLFYRTSYIHEHI